MTDTTHSGRRRRPTGLYGWLRARWRRFLKIGVLLGVIVGAYVLGFEVAYRDLGDAKQLNQQLQTESQRLKKQIVDQNAEMLGLQGSLARVQAKLNQIMPAKDTYQITPNQSLIVADGRLTIGLMGSPTNQNINLNINGRPQLAVSGDVIEVTVNPSTTCHVRIQAFDMFKAIVTATCP